MCAAIRARVGQLYYAAIWPRVRIIYGGSVKGGKRAPNCSPRADVDGALVGGASLDAVDFAAICTAQLTLVTDGAAKVPSAG